MSRLRRLQRLYIFRPRVLGSSERERCDLSSFVECSRFLRQSPPLHILYVTNSAFLPYWFSG